MRLSNRFFRLNGSLEYKSCFTGRFYKQSKTFQLFVTYKIDNDKETVGKKDFGQIFLIQEIDYDKETVDRIGFWSIFCYLRNR